MSRHEAHAAVEAIWRIEQAKLIAGLTRVVRDVSLAEELAQEALVAALDRWPSTGVPDRPGAWLMQTAKNRAIDLFRRNTLIERKHAELGHELELDQAEAPDPDTALDDHVGDDLLGLIFTACHPVLSPEAQAALTLRLLGGLTTAEIARAFLVPEPTMAQRIVRAKRTLSEAKVPFEVPRGAAMSERLGSVLAVLYLIFNEGYSATAGEDWIRPQLCEEAMRLGRVLAGLAPQEPEVHGLVALMEIQASRFRARTGADGEPVLLARQDRTRWDRLLITRGLAAIEQAGRLAGPRGPYLVQAEIAACHARARSADATDWSKIATLYGELAVLSPSPIIELNRAVAVSMAQGPAAALPLVDRLAAEQSLKLYHLLPAVRADLLSRLGRHAEAAADYARAAEMATNHREKDLLHERAAFSLRGERPPR